MLESRKAKEVNIRSSNEDSSSNFFTRLFPKNRNYLFCDLIDDWKKSSWGAFSMNTKIVYNRSIKRFTPLLTIEVESFNPKTIDLWIDYMKSPETRKTFQKTRTSLEREYQVLKTIIFWYMENNDDSKLSNPFKKRHRKSLILKAKVKKSEFMTPEDFNKFYTELTKRNYMLGTMALVQTQQLLRISEVTAMKWEFVDFKTGSYKLCEHIVWERSKDRKIASVSPGTKNLKAGSYVILPLRQKSVEALRELYEAQKRNDNLCEFIFHDQKQILHYRYIQYNYNTSFKRAGLNFSSTHICRHTGATNFLEETGDVLALKQMGNWASVDQAMHYGKILSSRARKAIEKIESPLQLKTQTSS